MSSVKLILLLKLCKEPVVLFLKLHVISVELFHFYVMAFFVIFEIPSQHLQFTGQGCQDVLHYLLVAFRFPVGVSQASQV